MRLGKPAAAHALGEAVSAPAFHEALRSAVEARDLPLERLAAHLRSRGHTVSIATLSYWQSGRSAPARPRSLLALGALESVLGVPRGHLAALLPTPPSSPSPGPVALGHVLSERASLDTVLADLGLVVDRGLSLVSSHTRAFADHTTHTPSVITREVMTATETGTDTYVIVAGHPARNVEVEVTPLAGCSLRRATRSLADSYVVAELEIPTLRRGDPHLVEYEIAFGDVAESVEHHQAMVYSVTPLRELYLEVVFQPDALPTQATLLQTQGGTQSAAPAHLRDGVLSLVRTGFGPGAVGFRWAPAGAEGAASIDSYADPTG